MAINETNIEAISEKGDAYAAAGDITIEKKNIYESKSVFRELDLKHLNFDEYIKPIQAEDYVQMTIDRRLLILGGHGYNKHGLAKYIARQLHEKELGKKEMAIKLWLPSAEPEDIVAYLQEHEEANVFLLNNISPSGIHHKLSNIFDEIQNCPHFAIFTTNIPKESWNLSDILKDVYISEVVFSINVLTQRLREKLYKDKKSLPEPLCDDTELMQSPEVCEISFQDIVKSLKQPDKIDLFVQRLLIETCPLSKSRLIQLVKECSEDDICQWYHNILNPRQQLLAIGLSFFESLFDDQFFASMDHIVESVWRKRDPSLRALDYCDLEDLHTYFPINPVMESYSIIDVKYSDQRRILIEAAWDTHRRQILSALPAIADLAEKSVSAWNMELYGTEERRELIRTVVSETLSDIGLIALDSGKSVMQLESVLLRLAANDKIMVQAVAARSMARWREYQYDEKLFSMLERWQKNERNKKKRSGNQKEIIQKSLLTYIRSTVALVIAYASLYDPPNCLNERIVNMMEEFVTDENKFVFDRFSYYTLPFVVCNHLSQFKNFLYEKVRFARLRDAIGYSLARAYSVNPEEVVQIINEWTEECEQKRPTRTNKKDFFHREALCATIAITYGYINYEKRGPLSHEKAVDQLKKILDMESHPYIRNMAIRSLLFLMTSSFENIEPLLQNPLEKISEKEWDTVVNKLMEIYKIQRRDMENGERILKFVGEDTEYPIWIDAARPITAVEEAINKWMVEKKNPKSQQIALRSQIKFIEVFDWRESKVIEDFKKQRKKEEEEAKKSDKEKISWSSIINALMMGYIPYSGKKIKKLILSNS
ncbi:MAG: hypothetical protein GY795_01795 [Desulfobacterales bacterium]|nr:hypothetical protein [Desulfobacterales bacterium]